MLQQTRNTDPDLNPLLERTQRALSEKLAEWDLSDDEIRDLAETLLASLKSKAEVRERRVLGRNEMECL
ncbi:MAG: hypothetical protein P4M08_10865 [Oligoflexia bacterium]|nr:hypothetical protein [Oligoflexia bacterium]